jgi:hypothetical protein
LQAAVEEVIMLAQVAVLVGFYILLVNPYLQGLIPLQLELAEQVLLVQPLVLDTRAAQHHLLA